MDNFIELNTVFDDPSDNDIVSIEYGTIQRPRTKSKSMIVNVSKILTIEKANPLNEKLYKVTFDNGDFVVVEDTDGDLLQKLQKTK